MIHLDNWELSTRQKNVLLILDTIIESEPVCAADISIKTGLSISTISRVLSTLKKLNLIQTADDDCVVRGVGRKPESVLLNCNYGYLVHFCSEYPNLSCTVSDFSGNTLLQRVSLIEQNISPDNFVEQTNLLINEVFSKLRLSKKKILSIGLSIPCLIDMDGNVITRVPNFPRLNHVPIRDLLQRRFGVPVILSNIARSAAVGEHISSYSFFKNLVYVYINTFAVGSGIIINDCVLTGKQNSAGEVGDQLVNYSDFKRITPKDTGHAEQILCLATLYQKIQSQMDKGYTSKLSTTNNSNTDLNIEMIEQAIMQGDSALEAIYEEYLHTLACLLITIITVIDPDVLLLGGDFKTENVYTATRINEIVQQIVQTTSNIQISTLGTNAPNVGGLQQLKEYVWNNIIVDKIVASVTT